MKTSKILICLSLLFLSATLLINCKKSDDPVLTDSNFVVAGGQLNYDGIVRYSENGTAWHPDNMTNISQTQYINGLAYGDNYYVGVGTGIYSFQSEDGINWITTHLDSIVQYNDIAVGEYHNQSPWKPYFVAVGNSGAVIFSSTHGKFWDKGSSGIPYNLNGVAFGYTASGLSTFVTVGNCQSLVPRDDPSQGTILYSITAGESWIEHSSGGTTRDLYCTAFGNGRFIAAGESGEILYSSNGAAWTTAISNSTKDIYGLAYGIASNTATWVAVGEEGLVMYSQDNGINWTAGEYDSNKKWRSVIFANNKFFAVGFGYDDGYTNGVEGKIIYSNDGITWSQANAFSGHENHFRDIVNKE